MLDFLVEERGKGEGEEEREKGDGGFYWANNATG